VDLDRLARAGDVDRRLSGREAGLGDGGVGAAGELGAVGEAVAVGV
jgi:hypothetical protein